MKRTLGLLIIALATVTYGFPRAVEPPSSNCPGGSRNSSSLFDTTLVSRIDRGNLERIVAKLSGHDTIMLDGSEERIVTRYASSPAMNLVRRYLVREIKQAGYEPVLYPFVLQITKLDLTGSAISSNLDTLWIADAGGRVFIGKSFDAFSSIESISDLGQAIFTLERDSVGHLWAGGRLRGSAGGCIFRSQDGGQSWTLAASGTEIYTIATIVFGSRDNGMAGGSGGTVLFTRSGGERWSRIDPARVGYETMNGSASTGPRHYWFVGASGALLDTPDLGSTWRVRRLFWGNLAAIDFYGSYCGVAVGSRHAFYTRDGGETWTDVPLHIEFTAVAMLDSLRVVAAADSGQIWFSEDGGAVWNRFGGECSLSADVWSIARRDRSSAWLVGRDLVRRISIESGSPFCSSHAFADTVWSKNIVFRKTGEIEPARRVVLCAHYDSYSGATPLLCAPGADDNATGTAAVIECARVLRSEKLERTVEFVLFDAEELGLRGSRNFVSSLDSNVSYECALNLDMIGWEPGPLMTAIISGRESNPADSALALTIQEAIDSFGIDLDAPLVHGERLTSDHVSFWEAGVPAVLLVEGRRSELTPYYHSCSDGATTINYAFHTLCTEAALGAISMLSGLVEPKPEIPGFALRQNYPNPFNMGTIASYELPADGTVELSVFDVSGRLVAIVDRGRRQAGVNFVRWDGKDLDGKPVQSGLYFLRLRCDAGVAVRKMVVLR